MFYIVVSRTMQNYIITLAEHFLIEIWCNMEKFVTWNNWNKFSGPCYLLKKLDMSYGRSQNLHLLSFSFSAWTSYPLFKGINFEKCLIFINLERALTTFPPSRLITAWVFQCMSKGKFRHVRTFLIILIFRSKILWKNNNFFILISSFCKYEFFYYPPPRSHHLPSLSLSFSENKYHAEYTGSRPNHRG